MSVFIHANKKPNLSSGKEKTDKWGAIFEAVTITFLVTFIPKLIELGGPPTCLEEVWVSILSSILMAIYTYMRMRGIDENE